LTLVVVLKDGSDVAAVFGVGVEEKQTTVLRDIFLVDHAGDGIDFGPAGARPWRKWAECVSNRARVFARICFAKRIYDLERRRLKLTLFSDSFDPCDISPPVWASPPGSA